MEVTTKLFSLDKCNSMGMVIPKEVMERGLEDLKKSGKEILISHPKKEDSCTLIGAIGKLNDIRIEGNDVVGTIISLPTPDGEAFEEILKHEEARRLAEDKGHLLIYPNGFGHIDPLTKEFSDIEISHFNAEIF